MLRWWGSSANYLTAEWLRECILTTPCSHERRQLVPVCARGILLLFVFTHKRKFTKTLLLFTHWPTRASMAQPHQMLVRGSGPLWGTSAHKYLTPPTAVRIGLPLSRCGEGHARSNKCGANPASWAPLMTLSDGPRHRKLYSRCRRRLPGICTDRMGGGWAGVAPHVRSGRRPDTWTPELRTAPPLVTAPPRRKHRWRLSCGHAGRDGLT